MYLVVALIASVIALVSTISLYGAPSTETTALLTNLGVYVLLAFYCLDKALKLLEPTKAETDNPKKADK
jgi:hypothetical protein